MKDNLLGIYTFLCCCICILATIGGTAYLITDGHILFGVAVICMAAMAFPYVYNLAKGVMQNNDEDTH